MFKRQPSPVARLPQYSVNTDNSPSSARVSAVRGPEAYTSSYDSTRSWRHRAGPNTGQPASPQPRNARQVHSAPERPSTSNHHKLAPATLPGRRRSGRSVIIQRGQRRARQPTPGSPFTVYPAPVPDPLDLPPGSDGKSPGDGHFPRPPEPHHQDQGGRRSSELQESVVSSDHFGTVGRFPRFWPLDSPTVVPSYLSGRRPGADGPFLDGAWGSLSSCCDRSLVALRLGSARRSHLPVEPLPLGTPASGSNGHHGRGVCGRPGWR